MSGDSKLSREKIELYLGEVGRRLAARGLVGDILISGGAAMVLVYGSRETTKDIDAMFEPNPAISEIVAEMAEEYPELEEGWLNDGVKGYMSSTTEQVPFATYGALSVLTVSPEYLLSMKLMASRPDTKDREDIAFLVRELGYRTPEEALARLEEHFPTQSHHVKAQYVLEELMGN